MALRFDAQNSLNQFAKNWMAFSLVEIPQLQTNLDQLIAQESNRIEIYRLA